MYDLRWTLRRFPPPWVWWGPFGILGLRHKNPLYQSSVYFMKSSEFVQWRGNQLKKREGTEPGNLFFYAIFIASGGQHNQFAPHPTKLANQQVLCMTISVGGTFTTEISRCVAKTRKRET